MTKVRREAVVIGASAGALDALSTLLPALPATFHLPILVVVHVPPDKDSMLTRILGAKCPIPVREAEDKEPIERGTVYVAPPDYHMLVEQNRRISLSSEEPVLYSRPSIDVLFETAAEAYGFGLMGIVLTGANSDGARGLRAIVDAGGIALVQNPETALASVMPQSALAACPESHVMSLEEMARLMKGDIDAL